MRCIVAYRVVYRLYCSGLWGIANAGLRFGLVAASMHTYP